jgi:transcriptional/translational regulatory protein YebC/TACO1
MEDAEEGKLAVYVGLTSYSDVKSAIEAAGFKIAKDEIIWKAKNDLPISDKTTAEKILKLIDRLEEDDDVNNVYTDADIDESVLSELS